MIRYGRFFNASVVPFLYYLASWLEEKAPDRAGNGPGSLAWFAHVLLRIQWNMNELVKVDPDGVNQLRISEMEAMEGRQSDDEAVWSRVIVEVIDKAFWDAESNEPYQSKHAWGKWLRQMTSDNDFGAQHRARHAPPWAEAAWSKYIRRPHVLDSVRRTRRVKRAPAANGSELSLGARLRGSIARAVDVRPKDVDPPVRFAASTLDNVDSPLDLLKLRAPPG